MHQLREKVLQFVKEQGPVLPVRISKFISSQSDATLLQNNNKLIATNTLFAGALLSELIANRLLKATIAKIGGSPLYYVLGQEPKLVTLRDHLSERPRMAFDLLKEHLVLRDRDSEPWIRVALREIKDFAVPLNVVIVGEVEVFWKWYLLSDKEAEPLIDRILNGDKIEAAPEEQIAGSDASPVVGEVMDAEAVREVENPPVDVQAPAEGKKKKAKEALKSFFYEDVLSFAKKNKIEVLKSTELKKGKEYLMLAKVPSVVGSLTYLVLAKHKKKISDGDIAVAYSEALHHNLPLLLLCSGEVSKKGLQLLEEKCKSVTFKRL